MPGVLRHSPATHCQHICISSGNFNNFAIEMETKNTSSNYQMIFSKWLLATVLAFSFFNFSGYTISAVQTKADRQQTSPLGNTAYKSAKSISYKRALKHVLSTLNNSFFKASGYCLSVIHSQLLHVREAAHSKPYTAILSHCFLYQLKSADQNDEDDLAIALG
jgi:hypothetical protein